MSSGSIGGEKCIKKFEFILALAPGCHQQARHYAVGHKALRGTGSGANFAENNHLTYRLFGLVAGRFDLWMF